MGMVLAGLGWLASADMAAVPVAVQADCLSGLERALAVHAAARANALAAFTARAGYEADGQGSARAWLAWQTRVTGQAAAGALASMRRLAAHPAVAAALGGGVVSVSWARLMCEWTGRLPAAARGQADVILVAAAAGGAGLDDLAGLAEEMRARLAAPDRDGGGFAGRGLRLATTLGGAGRLAGDLTPPCAAALRAVLDALGKRAGPDDTHPAQPQPPTRHRRLTGRTRPTPTGRASPGRRSPLPVTARPVDNGYVRSPADSMRAWGRASTAGRRRPTRYCSSWAASLRGRRANGYGGTAKRRCGGR